MANVYYEKDADAGLIGSRKVAVIGYGSQGHAHALNLMDSGVDVRVGLREGSGSWAKAEAAGLRVTTIAQATSEADLVMILLPDTEQAAVYEAEIEPNLTDGDALFFAHGLNIRFGHINPGPGIDVGMVAPKGPGHLVRRTYESGGGIPSLIAVSQDASGKAKALALSYAHALGATRAGVLETTFEEETETDLFGEQVVLCGGLTELVMAGFETLVDAGYQPESAYFECLHEVKLIVDLMYEQGIAGMRFSISDTAEYGDLTRGPRIINSETRAEMRRILDEIQDGRFAAEWIAENKAGRPKFNELRAKGKEHPIEKVGRRAAGDDALDLCRQGPSPGRLRRLTPRTPTLRNGPAAPRTCPPGMSPPSENPRPWSREVQIVGGQAGVTRLRRRDLRRTATRGSRSRSPGGAGRGAGGRGPFPAACPAARPPATPGGRPRPVGARPGPGRATGRRSRGR